MELNFLIDGMMLHIDLMIFDLDGTLISSGEDIAASVNYMLDRIGRKTMPPDMVIGFIGDGVQRLIERALNDSREDRHEEALKIFLDHYAEHMLDTTDLYPGIREVLDHFDHKKKVIISNKRHDFTTKIVQSLGIRNYFEDVYGADRTPYKKPDARLLMPILDLYQIEPERTVVIGDGINDILLAKNVGALSCSFLNGLSTRDVLLELQPDLTYEMPSDLLNLFS